MDIFNSSNIKILDLPDEMLRAIFNKLDMVDIFYSLIDINQRFDRLAFDPLYIYQLDIVIKRDDIPNSSTDIPILDKLCEQILPRINEEVDQLTLNPVSMKRIITAANYPQLHSLSLVNYQPEILLEYLTDNTMLRLLNNQITHLTIDIHTENVEIPNRSESNTFIMILLVSKCLSDLTYLQESSEKYLTIWSSNISYKGSLRPTLTNLTINVNTLDDCLYLLNWCLESLSTLIIRIDHIKRSALMIDNTKKLLKLKCFSLTIDWHTFDYDQQVVPLLQRMVNLEELTLFLSIIRTKSTYIDGYQLYDEVLHYMPQLKNFHFSIHTCILTEYNRMKIALPSNNDIRNSFIERGIQSCGLFADDQFLNHRANCHVYSLPYHFNDLLFLSNCFQGGKFDQVRLLSMRDQRPFEHGFFQIISQDFPFLQQLIISNDVPQKKEPYQFSTLITFNHLFKLRLYAVHIDYIIQFLSEKNTRLPCLTNLAIQYRKLVSVTNHFTNPTTRLNCSKIKSLVTYELLVPPQNFHSYFPSL